MERDRDVGAGNGWVPAATVSRLTRSNADAVPPVSRTSTVRFPRRPLLASLAALGGSLVRPSGRAKGWPANRAGDGYEITHARYTRRAFAATFSTAEGTWDPAAGYAANRAYLSRVYGYYGTLYLTEPSRFLWAGFARLGGASVVGGLEALTRRPLPGQPDPSPLTVTLVAIAKAIFLDLGWQHEAFLDHPDEAVRLGRGHDARFPARASYESAWAAIASGEPDRAASGNRDLLANEQFTIVQPLYDRLVADPVDGPLFVQAGRQARRIHPYGRDFAEVVPDGDLTDPDQRWSWIAEPGGLWDAWVALPPAERRRLVELPFADLVAQRWEPAIEELVPG